MNVAPTHLIIPYQIKEEKPRVVKEVQMFDGKRYPVTTVSLANIVLIQEGYKLDIGSQRFFCFEVPEVKELIIGDRTLKYHGVLLQLFQDHAFKLADSYIFYEEEMATITEEPALFIQSHQRYFLFRSARRKLPPIHHQKYTDVSTDAINHEDRLIHILSNRIDSPNHSVESKFIESMQKKKEDLDSQHFENFEKLPPDHQNPPVLVSDLIDNVPDESNETGIGEGNIDLKEKQDTINAMIKEKFSQAILSDVQKSELEEIMLRNLSSWGIRQSIVRMSEMHPIEVAFTPAIQYSTPMDTT
eukprot:augustus_masked-scaffold_7-processed-gene-10.1-mRNA-1 protein AED:1.00 eAED:1.00 QI:0/0/0/0/1/1/3/0/300